MSDTHADDQAAIEQSGSPASPAPRDNERPRERPGLFSRIGESVRQFGVDAVSVALGRLIEPPQTDETAAAAEHQADHHKLEEGQRRVSMLHDVTEKLRGAADGYIAAKLDEIEALVDTKLDEVEDRIDEKIDSLQSHLRLMRDQELRHRLRLLKITLIFTVVVALLSLGYKWIVSLYAVQAG